MDRINFMRRTLDTGGSNLLTEPVRIAAEAALYSICSNDPTDPVEYGVLAGESLPPGSTDFERGMAFGMGVVLGGMGDIS